MPKFENDSIFWVEVDKISPNPYQPRRDFNEERLRDLAESIRQYGVLQPLTVTRKEKFKDDGIEVEYELIAGERRHRASKIAGLKQVPVIIRSGEESSKMKLELAIIENLQREDLNPIERAQAFKRLADEFDFTHADIGKKVGRSREYVSNSIRLLGLPDDIQSALIADKISEGHARSLLMLRDKPQEQQTLFKEVIYKQMTVRDTEKVARKVAKDKVRKRTPDIDPEILELEKELSDSFGTRVHIEQKPKDKGGKIVIDFFSKEDLETIRNIINSSTVKEVDDLLAKYIENQEQNGGGEDHDRNDDVTVEEVLQEDADDDGSKGEPSDQMRERERVRKKDTQPLSRQGDTPGSNTAGGRTEAQSNHTTSHPSDAARSGENDKRVDSTSRNTEKRTSSSVAPSDSKRVAASQEGEDTTADVQDRSEHNASEGGGKHPEASDVQTTDKPVQSDKREQAKEDAKEEEKEQEEQLYSVRNFSV